MKERRSLVEGLALAPAEVQELEREFVYPNKAPSVQAPTPQVAVPTIPRAPLTTRIREDYAKALKRASLERQLAGVAPNTLQDILEEAIEPWLRSNGYIDG